MRRAYLFAAGGAGCLLLASSASAVVTFQFTYFDSMANPNTGFFDPVLGPARKAALEAVAADIGSRIGQTATVQIGVAPSQLDGTGFIGTAGATFLNSGAPASGIRDGEVYRRIVLGAPDTDPGLDAGMQFDFGYTVALSGTPGPGIAYFPDVARHELTHVLGFGSFLQSSGLGRNSAAPDVYTRFDTFLKTQGGNSILDGSGVFLNPPDFATAYTQGLVFDGPLTTAANGGVSLPLYFSSPSHSKNTSDVMFPSPAVGYVRDAWTPLDEAVLRDLGYDIVPEPGTLSLVLGATGVLLARRRRHRH